MLLTEYWCKFSKNMFLVIVLCCVVWFCFFLFCGTESVWSCAPPSSLESTWLHRNRMTESSAEVAQTFSEGLKRGHQWLLVSMNLHVWFREHVSRACVSRDSVFEVASCRSLPIQRRKRRPHGDEKQVDAFVPLWRMNEQRTSGTYPESGRTKYFFLLFPTP